MNDKKMMWQPLCMCIGCGLGLLIGALTGNMGAGLLIGVAAGSSVGILIDHRKR